VAPAPPFAPTRTRGTLRLVRWIARVGVMLAVAACTLDNAAYEATGHEATRGDTQDDGEPSESGAVTSQGQTTPGTGPDTTSEPPGDTNDTSDTSDTSDTRDTDDPPIGFCEADLYGINDQGILYLIDVDNGTLVEGTTSAGIASWAISTHPMDGTIYVSALDEPTMVQRIDPHTLMLDERSFPVPPTRGESVGREEVMARATFDPRGQLWLGTDDTNSYVSFWPDDAMGTFSNVGTEGRGGDMMFFDSECAMVPNLQGLVSRVCFDINEITDTFMVMEVPMAWGFSGIARDARDQVWLSTIDTDGTLSYLVRVDHESEPWVVTMAYALEVGINDLSEVVELPNGC
jgi:hypothetical protein